MKLMSNRLVTEQCNYCSAAHVIKVKHKQTSLEIIGFIITNKIKIVYHTKIIHWNVVNKSSRLYPILISQTLQASSLSMLSSPTNLVDSTKTYLTLAHLLFCMHNFFCFFIKEALMPKSQNNNLYLVQFITKQK